MSSGVQYPMPTYIPPLPIFNPLFFPQSFGTTTTSGGGGGQTNIFPNGLTSGNVITMDGGTGGGGGTGLERRITGLSQIDWVDINSTIPTAITGYMTLNGNTLEIGSATASSGINVNLLGSTVSANGVVIATGGNVSNDISNNFLVGTTQTFSGAISVNNLQSNIGQLGSNNTAIGENALVSLSTGVNNTAFGEYALTNETTGSQNIAIGVFSLNSLTSGNINTAMGYSSLQSSTLDSGNTAIGLDAGKNLSGNGTNSNYNTFIGLGAGQYQTTGTNNIAIGFNSGASSGLTTLNNTISIGYGITPISESDIIFAPKTNLGVKFFYDGTNGWAFTSSSATLKIHGQIGSGQAGRLQIVSGSNGGGSLQLEDNSAYPPTTANYGSFASVGGLPFYYSPLTSTWTELGNKFVSLTSNNGTIAGLGTQWQITPLVVQPISTNPTPPYGTTFSYTLYTNITPTPQTINSSQVQLNIQGLFTSITGTGVAQQYTYTPNGTTYWGYVLSSTINAIGALTDLQFQFNRAGINNNFYFTCSSTDTSLLSTTLTLIIRPTS